MDIIRVKTGDHITVDTLTATLAEIEEGFGRAKVGVLIDMLGANVFEMDTKPVFVQWANTNSRRIAGIAVLTTHTVWHMLVSTMGHVIKVRMLPFDDETVAVEWLKASRTGARRSSGSGSPSK